MMSICIPGLLLVCPLNLEIDDKICECVVWTVHRRQKKDRLSTLAADAPFFQTFNNSRPAKKYSALDVMIIASSLLS